MKFWPFLFFFFILTWSACQKDGSDQNFFVNTPVENNEMPQMENITPNGDEQYLNFNSDYIFDQEKLPSFNLILSESALAFLNNNPAAEQYVEGQLIFEGDTISPVGIRYKGSIGGFVGCVSGSDWTNPTGRKTCSKLSMKVKINWEGREEKFYGLKKLQFHSMNLDNSQMRDRLAYWLFSEMDVPAPRAIHARLLINGVFAGLFSLVEQIDGRFTRYNFDEGEGNLYKEVWPIGYNGLAASSSHLTKALKTNEDEYPSVELLRGLGLSVVNASPNNLKEVIESYMDLNEILSYWVVDRTIRHDDGPYHYYCGGSNCKNHNFYWYEEPTAGKLHLIPWDMDNAFENIIVSNNPVTSVADDWGEISNNCEPFSAGGFGFGLQQWSASCDRLINGWASYEEEFEQIKSAFISGPLSESAVNNQLDKWTEQIRAATAAAENQFEDAVSIAQWEQSIDQLKSQLAFARNN